jgi:hypothetical protein
VSEPKEDPPNDPPVDDDEKVDPDNDPDNPDNDPDQGKPDPKDKKDTTDPEVAKAIRRRDAAIKARQTAEAEVAALKEKYEKDKTDPIKVANGRLVKAEARTVLTAAGVTDKSDQAAILDFLGLDSVSVTDSGEVDTGAIEDRVEELRRIFGKAPAKPAKRTPSVDGKRGQGDGAKPADAAQARRRAMLGL